VAHRGAPPLVRVRRSVRAVRVSSAGDAPRRPGRHASARGRRRQVVFGTRDAGAPWTRRGLDTGVAAPVGPRSPRRLDGLWDTTACVTAGDQNGDGRDDLALTQYERGAILLSPRPPAPRRRWGDRAVPVLERHADCDRRRRRRWPPRPARRPARLGRRRIGVRDSLAGPKRRHRAGRGGRVRPGVADLHAVRRLARTRAVRRASPGVAGPRGGRRDRRGTARRGAAAASAPRSPSRSRRSTRRRAG
jgi:hypothetical protein